MVVYVIVYSIIIFLIAAVTVALSLMYVKRQRESLRRTGRDSALRKQGERTFVDIMCESEAAAFIVFKRKTQEFLYITPNISRFTGVSAEELYADMNSLNAALGRQLARKLAKEVREWDGKGVFEATFPNGDRTTVLGTVRAEYGGEEYAVYIFTDGTDRERVRANMQKELEEALRLATEKSSFMSSMSHEIRTPMNGIMGMMSLAKMNINDPARVEQCLEKAGYLASFLIGMINDILDISKIESGRMQLYNNNFDIFALADKMNNMFASTMQSRGINYKVETVDFTARILVGDELRLTQVITNLVSNAQKFTPADGHVTVTFKQLDMIGDKVQFMIRVRDTGKGIAPENIRKIMKPFEQEDASTSHNYGGTGLGLAITDNFVKLMGGNIVVDSELGKGSDFSVFLSLPVAEGVDQDLDRPIGAAEKHGDIDFEYDGCRILLAEDNEINAEIAIEILESDGALVTLARDGQELVDIFTAQPENSFDLLLVDIQMPKMDGRTATKAIRSCGRADAKDITIIALSADAFVEDQVKSKQAGMDGHVSKPIDFDELKKTVGKLFAAKRRMS